MHCFEDTKTIHSNIFFHFYKLIMSYWNCNVFLPVFVFSFFLQHMGKSIYKGPYLVAKAVNDDCPDKNIRILDIACGTGFVGQHVSCTPTFCRTFVKILQTNKNYHMFWNNKIELGENKSFFHLGKRSHYWAVFVIVTFIHCQAGFHLHSLKKIQFSFW